MRYSPDGRWLVTGGTDGKIIMMDRQTGRTWVLGHHNDWVNSVLFTRTLGSCSPAAASRAPVQG